MSERSPSADPSYKPDPDDDLDGRRRIGLNPAEGDVGTVDPPRGLPKPPPTHWPDEGQDIHVGGRVAERRRPG